MGNLARAAALNIIKGSGQHSHSDLLEALYILRYDAKPSDVWLLLPMLKNEDCMIVASVLYSLYEVYEHERDGKLKKLIYKFAQGDPRDFGEMPIQLQAIYFVQEWAEVGDVEAIETLWQIAENRQSADAPRTTAWEGLADLFEADWQSEDADTMFMNPESEESERIRKRIRSAASK